MQIRMEVYHPEIDGGLAASYRARQKQLSADEIERIARVYRQFKREGTPELVPGFCAVAALDKIREYNYALTPGRYVGASDDGIEGDPFEERYPHLRTKLMAGLEEGKTLTREIARSLDLLANV